MTWFIWYLAVGAVFALMLKKAIAETINDETGLDRGDPMWTVAYGALVLAITFLWAGLLVYMIWSDDV